MGKYHQGQVTTPLMQSLAHRKILNCVKKCNTIQLSLKDVVITRMQIYTIHLAIGNTWYKSITYKKYNGLIDHSHAVPGSQVPMDKSQPC